MRLWILLIVLGSFFVFSCSSDDNNNNTTSEVVENDVLDATASNETVGEDTNEVSSVEETTDVIPEEVSAPEAFVSFITYNTGLAYGYVDYADKRFPKIKEALQNIEADFVCLQEVWKQDDAQSLIDDLKDKFPYNYWELTKEDGSSEPQCTVDEVTPLKECVAENCAEVDPANIASCALSKCGNEFNSLSPQCQGCIAANLGKSIDEIFQVCVEGQGASYSWEGHNGLLLLSKYELTNTEYLKLDSTLVVRVVLHARAEVPDVGTFDIFCTHLTADLGEVEYPGKFESWGDEMGKQIDAILSWIPEKSAEGSTVVVMGDFNCGPDIGDTIKGEWSQNYEKFINAGFSDPAVDAENPFCSWCSDNTLVKGGESHLIDHVFFKGVSSDVKLVPSRVFDEKVTIQTDSGDVETNLSDHFGVKVDYTK